MPKVQHIPDDWQPCECWDLCDGMCAYIDWLSILRVLSQNGISRLYNMLEIHHSGPETMIYTLFRRSLGLLPMHLCRDHLSDMPLGLFNLSLANEISTAESKKLYLKPFQLC